MVDVPSFLLAILSIVATTTTLTISDASSSVIEFTVHLNISCLIRHTITFLPYFDNIQAYLPYDLYRPHPTSPFSMQYPYRKKQIASLRGQRWIYILYNCF